MARKDVVGAMVFSNSGDGCLSSKYINEGSKGAYTETCKLIIPDANGLSFCGNYTTVWLQDGGHEAGELEITYDKALECYKFYWRQNGKDIYEGTGMLYGELLVGSYWNV